MIKDNKTFIVLGIHKMETKPSKAKTIVYTANFGGKDGIIEVKKEPNTEYIYYTDTPVESETWDVVIIDVKKKVARKTARWFKTHSHLLFPFAEITIWMDARLGFASPLKSYIKELKRNDICFTQHPNRNCIYDEAMICSRQGFDDKEVIKDQVNKYREEEYPVDNGLVETGVTIRRNNLKTALFNERWWYEIDTYSIRDQISCNYCLWKEGMKYSMMPNEFIAKGKHKHAK